ncbi:Uncharacterised protein [Chlamydia trachomatis]|nr:Uncharacterised protein [Chlamydia trachomatis]CRH87855.1 Uncharacterised protein [Chlamydia trachomatis]CRI74486.1 Uncharacterised protein [Chlamydia trachomatis]
MAPEGDFKEAPVEDGSTNHKSSGYWRTFCSIQTSDPIFVVELGSVPRG